jgi:osmotically-inducible protein OsmY
MMKPFDLLVSSVLPGPRAFVQRRSAQDALEEMEREIDDTLINAAVKIAIHRDPLLRSAGIHVATSRNVVQLSGFVDSRQAIARAIETARNVRSVRAVRNDMLLK